jgi:hypothetical protein
LPAIHGFPNSTCDRSKIEKVGFAGHSGDRQCPTPSEGTYQSPFETRVKALVELGIRVFVGD